MAIKVNGTTVIDDNRNFTNIAGGFKTVNGTSVVGSGDISAGASTSYNAVGTYIHGFMANNGVTEGSTYAGSGINPAGMAYSSSYSSADTDYPTNITHGSSTLSGTWRAMGRSNYGPGSTRGRQTLFVRIS